MFKIMKSLFFLLLISPVFLLSLYAESSDLKDSESITKGLLKGVPKKDLEEVDASDAPKARGIVVTPKKEELVARPNGRIDLNILFEFDSSELDQSDKDQINELGKSLSSDELDQFNFLIVGHTDAKGSEVYNQSLSERRAHSVKNYIVSEYDVQSSRLKTQGWGEGELYDTSNPHSGVNRRVEIFRLD